MTNHQGTVQTGPRAVGATVPTRYAQIEITTHCNYSCFYCVGRSMPQRHMSLTKFREILARLPARPLTVSLQGEGEPMLHPAFWEMVADVRAAGHRPYTITNASALPYPEKVAAEFPEIGLSIDTLDPQLAEQIGRHRLDRVLRNLDRLLQHMPASRIIIHTVDMGQPLEELREFVALRGLRHVAQPLQRKEDYRTAYSTAAPPANHGRSGVCAYVKFQRMLYFDINGVEMPCAFIKDVTRYQDLRSLRESFAAGYVPACCTDCRELT